MLMDHSPRGKVSPKVTFDIKMVMTKNIGVNQFALVRIRLLGCARRRLALSLATLSCCLALAEV
jgi:hypothetical protein